MSDSDQQVSVSGIKQLQRAQKKLDDVQKNIKKYRNKRKQQTSIAKAPSPDLQKYFSFLSKQILNQDQINYNYTDRQPSLKPQAFTHTFQRFSQIDKQNNSYSINQKLQSQKNSSINKIEEYYSQRNLFLQQKITELKNNKYKVLADQKLLRRDNQQLQNKIQKQRHNKPQSNKIKELKIMIDQMRNNIKQDQEQHNSLIKKKQQIKKQLKQCVRNHKKNISQSLPFK